MAVVGKNNDGFLTFHDACAEGNLKMVESYLAEQGGLFACLSFMNNVDKFGYTGFHLACRYGKLNVVQCLLQTGFDMSIPDNFGYTGFHYACRCGKLKVIQLLIQEGCDINIIRKDGATGFHLACRYGELTVVRLLVSQREFEGINERVNSHGEMLTGLEILIGHGDDLYCVRANKNVIPIILLLIEAGAKLEKNYVFEELSSAIENRIFEITVMKEIIFEKCTDTIAKAITGFTMEAIMNTSFKNLSGAFIKI
jgi:ankyrin repeat protein